MSIPISYYDWQEQFKRSPSRESKLKVIDENPEALGINAHDFKIFLKKWKSKNLRAL